MVNMTACAATANNVGAVAFDTVGGIPVARLSRLEYFDIKSIFECGQAFRFDPVPGDDTGAAYSGVAYGRAIKICRDGGDILLYGVTPDDYSHVWLRYFSLDRDYCALSRDILSRSDKPVLAAAVEYGRGIRILAQEPWETLCSFIISQNNNIPRIKGLVGALSERLGERVRTPDGGTAYAFPTPRAVADAGVGTLAELKTGFRARYIYDAACRVCDGRLDLDAVAAAADTACAAGMLTDVCGVGPKVAACALLFGFGRFDAFPVDVWIKRVIERYFPGDFDPAALGPYAGLAQQYLFYYERGLTPGK